jgi:peptidase E
VSRKSIYLLAGGNWSRPGALVPLLSSVLAEAGKPRPSVAYIGAANGDSRMFLGVMRRLIGKAGAGSVVPVKLAHARADRAAAVATLRAADVVHVAGGDVEEGMRWLERHELGPALREAYERGAVFFGVSAGSIMLGSRWVRWRNPDDDDSAELFDCLGLAPLVCDTHAEEDGWVELAAAVKLLPAASPGYGIPTGGILRVGPRGGLEALVTPVAVYARDGSRVEQTGELRPKG